MSKSKPKILAFWSGPRNVSTAMMYSFAQRKDCTVLDEPYFGNFLKTTGVWRPSREEVLQQMKTSGKAVHEKVIEFEENEILFLKNMANHTVGLDLTYLEKYKNVILTRDPLKVLASYSKHIEKPTALDLGYAHQLEILEYAERNDLPMLVVNSDDVCERPEHELQRICSHLEIPFDTVMLHWEAGARQEDGVWAKYWYENVHKSTGFKSNGGKQYSLPSGLEKIYEESLELYQKIIDKK